MHLLTHCFLIALAISAALSARTFRISNRCNQKLWFGVQGNPLIYSGGFEVEAGASRDLSVPDGWVSGRRGEEDGGEVSSSLFRRRVAAFGPERDVDR